MQTTRISYTIFIFDGQINSINGRLQAISPDWGNQPRGAFLNVDSTKMTGIQSRVTNWNTNIRPVYQNPLTKHTVDGKGGTVDVFMNEFRTYVNPVLDFIAAASNADHDDEVAFNIVLDANRKDASHLTQKIAAECEIHAIQKGRGVLGCKVNKPSENPGRPNIPHEDGADEVEIAYFIVPKDANPNTVPNPDTLRTRERYSRATFDFHIGADYSGQWAQVFPRWYNSHYPNFASDWGPMITIMIP